MSERAFTMTSKQYCGSCGSFDLVKNSHTIMFCYGCDNKFSQKDFASNAVRTTPLTADDFFFQTNIRNRQLQKRQIKPLTEALGVSLIACAITGLILVKPAGEFQKIKKFEIEWVSNSPKIKEIYEIGLVKALQLEFNKLVKAKEQLL